MLNGGFIEDFARLYSDFTFTKKKTEHRPCDAHCRICVSPPLSNVTSLNMGNAQKRDPE
jgi:hypothetical protein